jgi:1-acyl-sn-glycerol-3-phosphate acyltransferase
MHIVCAENIPAQGAAIIAANHKSFLDAFFIRLSTHRHVRFMGKTELFRGPLGWLFLRLGAFPVRRGEADADAMETAQLILEQGGLVVIFPEGTRVDDPHAVGAPHHGAGRLALQSGAPIVPPRSPARRSCGSVRSRSRGAYRSRSCRRSTPRGSPSAKTQLAS